MLSYVGPKYDDLVNVYCHAHWGSPHPSFRREDVWEAGTLQSMEHPEMLYLPPSLPGSTPKKPEMVRNPTEGNLPDLEEMGHHELVDLVKQLLVERASKPTSLTNPNKDVSVAGHVFVNQESLVQSSQAILQGLAEGGYIHAKPQSLKVSLVMTRKINWILICGKGKSCLQPQPILGQLSSKQ